MVRFFVVGLLLLTLTCSVSAQTPWSEWDKKEVDRILTNSPWGQTQTETDTADMFAFRAGGISPSLSTNQIQGETAGAITFNYRVRFFSAQPIREAFARQVMLGNPKIQPQQLNSFINGDYSEMIVIAVTWDGADRRYTGIIGQAFDSATTPTVKNKAFLERTDGKRIQIDEYATATSDGTGAKFVFPRLVDGKPFIGEKDEFVRFVADMGRGVRVNWKFKVSDMKYNGRLEY